MRTMTLAIPSLLRAAAALPALVLALALATPAPAQEQSLPGGFTADQVQGIEEIVRDYLIRNPEVLIEALTIYQQHQKMAEEREQKLAVIERGEELARDPNSPVIGNPDGDVVIVEFFDYRCPYCRRVADDLRQTVEGDGKVRLVMKEYPILGAPSVRAARAALAAARQGKYEAYHFALMTQPGDMSDPHLKRVAKEVGLDVERLFEDMEDEAIDAMLQRNVALAEAIGVRGTPAFVFGDTLVPGAIDAETMRRLIDEARAKGS